MKKTLLVIGIAILIGSFFGYFLFKQTNVEIDTLFGEASTITVFQAGVFESEENAHNFSLSFDNAVVRFEDGLYRVYISVLESNGALERMKNYFDSANIKYHTRKINVTKNTFLEELRKYEQLILQTEEDIVFSAVNKKLLQLYEEMN